LVLASSGRRGRDEARGRLAHALSGLTRTAAHAHGLPFVTDDGGRHLANGVIQRAAAGSRWRMKSSLDGFRDGARHDVTMPVVDHEK
jgi:hypothetical protein